MSTMIQVVAGGCLIAAGMFGSGLESWFLLAAGSVMMGEGFARNFYE